MALFVGGTAQFLAGMWEFAAGNTFGATGTFLFVIVRSFVRSRAFLLLRSCFVFYSFLFGSTIRYALQICPPSDHGIMCSHFPILHVQFHPLLKPRVRPCSQFAFSLLRPFYPSRSNFAHGSDPSLVLRLPSRHPDMERENAKTPQRGRLRYARRAGLAIPVSDSRSMHFSRSYDWAFAWSNDGVPRTLFIFGVYAFGGL